MRNWLVDEDGKPFPRGYPTIEFWVKLKDKDKEIKTEGKEKQNDKENNLRYRRRAQWADREN